MFTRIINIREPLALKRDEKAISNLLAAKKRFEKNNCKISITKINTTVQVT